MVKGGYEALVDELVRVDADFVMLSEVRNYRNTRFCDRILFVSGGQITEMGTHEELMAKKGAYYKMFQVQSYYYREQGVAVHA